MNEQTRTDAVSQALTRQQDNAGALSFFDPNQFAHLQRLAKLFCNSELVPKAFQGEANLPNVVIALEMAQRLRAGCLGVMQSIYVVYGKPGWASTFIIACLNTSGRFEPLMFDRTGTGDNRQCVAWTVRHGMRLPAEVATLKQAKEADVPVFEGPACSIAIAKAEGWYDKNGSKWKTMPELMLSYRAATWFARLFAPELLMGMQSVDEITDTINVTPQMTAASRNAPLSVPEQPKQEATEAAATAMPTATATNGAADGRPEPGPLQKDLANVMERNGITIDEFQAWLTATRLYPNADAYPSFLEMPDAVCELCAKETAQFGKFLKGFSKVKK